MIIDFILLAIAFIALLIGTITDIKTREVPDWVNYSIIFAGLGIRTLYSAATFDWMYFMYGCFGFAIFTGIAYAMYYTAQWGGGDAKMLMGLGALIGMPLILNPAPMLLVFIINIVVFGALYGFVYTVALAVKHRKEFVKNFSGMIHEKTMLNLRRILLIAAVALILLVLVLIQGDIYKMMLIALIFMFYLIFYLFLFVKTVEQTAMFRLVEPEKITEGDWIANDVVVKGKRICGPKDLGISKVQIKKLIALKKAGKIKRIKVKYGIPFVPSFLIAFIMTLLLGVWWAALL